MDDRKDFIPPTNGFTKSGSDAAPAVVGGRHTADVGIGDRQDCPAFHRPTDETEESRTDLPSGHTVVTCCFHGPQVSQGLATALRLMGVEPLLEGGVAAWTEQNT